MSDNKIVLIFVAIICFGAIILWGYGEYSFNKIVKAENDALVIATIPATKMSDCGAEIYDEMKYEQGKRVGYRAFFAFERFLDKEISTFENPYNYKEEEDWSKTVAQCCLLDTIPQVLIKHDAQVSSWPLYPKYQ